MLNPDVMGGKPCARATRLRLHMIAAQIGEGQSLDCLLSELRCFVAECVAQAQRYAVSRAELCEFVLAAACDVRST